MVVVSYSGKEINAKLVYYGAGLSGKTTNLESIYEAVPDTSRGKMVSMKTQSDRTLFFDLLPLDLGEIMGFKTRFLLYTVPGQVFYNATRKLVLKGVDAIVFVADSEVGKMEENKESLANLRANLSEYGLKQEEIPWVIQYNKRDIPEVYTVEELNAELNPGGKAPFFEAVATQGKGVFETFRGISHLLMDKVTRELRRAPLSSKARSTEEPARSEATSSILDQMGPPAAPPQPKAPAPIAAPATISAAPPVPAIAQETGNYGRELTLDPSSGGGAPAPIPAVAVNPSSYGERDLDESSLPKDGKFRSSFGPQIDAAPATSPERPGVAAVQAPAAHGTIQSTPSRLHPMSGTTKAEASTTARPSVESQELVVPVKVPRGTQCEIVLRIILTDRD